MAEVVSTLMTAQAAGGDKSLARTAGSHVLTTYVEWTADVDQNDTVLLASIPVGAVIVGGRAVHTAFGASVVVDLGFLGTDQTDVLLDADDMSSVGTADFGDTAAKGNGYVVPSAPVADVVSGRAFHGHNTLIALFAGADPDSGTLQVTVNYLLTS